MPPYIASWGIIGAGWVASSFADDLALPRDGNAEILHNVAAVCAAQRAHAQGFIDAHLPHGASAAQAGLAPAPVACEGVDELLAREDVTLVYIATLAPSHYALARAALEAGKHVLTLPPCSADEWAALTALATERGLFLMESFPAMFLPAIRALSERLSALEVEHIEAMWCQRKLDVLPSPRVVGWVEPGPAKLPKSQVGRPPSGPLHDIGATLLLPSRMARRDIGVTAELTTRGIRDRCTLLRVEQPHTHARVMLNAGGRSHHCNITYEGGEFLEHVLKHELGVYNGLLTAIQGEEGPIGIQEAFPVQGKGLGIEADAVARDVRDGRLQNNLVSHAYTAETIRIFDSVAAQDGYVLPAGEQVGRAGTHNGGPWHADWTEME